MRGLAWRHLLATVGLLSVAGQVPATDFRLTGFGTVGYSRSSLDNAAYLRYIDDDGTFKADSLLGLQAEAQFTPQWSAAVQGVASAPSPTDDENPSTPTVSPR